MGRSRYLFLCVSALARARQRLELVARLVPREELGMAEVRSLASDNRAVFNLWGLGR